uniref:Uncharacterized protein n=1 Tax=Salix viminalis TaxID=40686 RepID=A0A6N2NM87_SALVM
MEVALFFAAPQLLFSIKHAATWLSSPVSSSVDVSLLNTAFLLHMKMPWSLQWSRNSSGHDGPSANLNHWLIRRPLFSAHQTRKRLSRCLPLAARSNVDLSRRHDRDHGYCIRCCAGL